ncbi:MAG: sigma-54-dependent Fis family transcriptional regulator [Deltaproteobacteria bacterium]|nr:sigma-54-dependent Fis family transcriptional regulator [Deltaproteobacteria bacterium]
MSKSPYAMNDRAEASSILMLDKDKLLQSIFRLSSFLTAPSDVNDMLVKILDEVVDSIGFDRGIIRLFDESRQNLVAKVVKNYNAEETVKVFSVALNIHEHDCIATKVAKSGQPIAIEVTATDPRITETDRMLTKIFDRGSYFCAPLKIGEEVIGIIAAWFKEETKFFPEEIGLFVTYANTLSMMIYNMRLFEANAEKIRRLMILQEAVSEMNSSHVLDNHIIEILVRSALKIARSDKVLASFTDVEKDRCLINEGGRVYIEERSVWEERIGPTIIREAIDTNTIATRQGSAGYPSLQPLFPGYPSELALPLNVKDKFKGVLYLANNGVSYSQDQIHVLDVLVKNASTSYDNAILHSMLSLEAKSLKTEVEKLKEREDILLGFHNILGKSKKMLSLFHVIKEVAGHNTNILIQGESGTGKELIARAIHRQGNRSNRSFVDVNCAAIPGTLLESELFGYEAGAFTDARKRKIGLLEYATGGTILLDEIGEMNIHIQAKFLRMLEDGHIRRLGGNESIPIDVRFIFSTNRDLSRMVSEGTFREDLYYRISVVPITIPPLRERTEDVLILARYYLDEFNGKFKKKVKGFSEDAERILTSYQWPGNVRELKNIIERIMILHGDGERISVENLPAEMRSIANHEKYRIQIDNVVPQLTSEGIDFSLVTERIANDVKRQIIDSALAMSRGNKTEAARRLGISRFKLIRERKKIENDTSAPRAHIVR